ncbi:unnamed protein product [Hyaloperonospora brassicae]|uniref:Uncharacterized protein n=1 Tax=Hyaloperonospora brassicae TaxID=162125 RepID=A0AAV0UHD8_HYABA|nr:unnamed protein product [Hyaloperonospora brassicae]
MRSRGGWGHSSALLGCLLLQLVGQKTEAASAHYSLNLTGIASGTAYTLSVNIGTLDDSGSQSGSNAFRLIADTGSSNDAVLGSECCGPKALVTYSCEASSTCAKAEGDAVTLAFAGANIDPACLAYRAATARGDWGNIPTTSTDSKR